MPEANAEAKPAGIPGALELSEETTHRLAELRALSEKAEAGDKEARKELRLMVRASSPEVIGRASDVGRTAGRTLAHTAAGGDPLTEEALYAKLDTMRAEIAGEDPTPLEVSCSPSGWCRCGCSPRCSRCSLPPSTAGTWAAAPSGSRRLTSSNSRGS